MSRVTIDYGIDLGTTNSSVAVNRGTDIEVIKNEEGFDYTPSVFWIDRNDKEFVGRRAKERRFFDPENSDAEFKLKMGTREPKVFARSGRRMLPEELSAEVLKSLKADVKKRRGDVVQAAVITVPAAFGYPQTEATRRAAGMAGIEQVVLLPEPSAAALAYGAANERERAFWLIYDLGGGTFDAAVVEIWDGRIKPLNWEGDNNLGGKRIDWAIVEQLLAPAVVSHFGVGEFTRFNRQWAAAFAKLKEGAEQAKILLSSEERESVSIDIDSLFKGCEGFKGGDDDFQFELKRREIESLIGPLVERSLDICRKALRTGKGNAREMGVDEIAKVLLVGGPTLTPYLRARLEDFCPRLDFSQDPLTVVSRGAAIAAGRQLKKVSTPASPSGFAVELFYEPTGKNPKPPIGGTVKSAGTDDFDFSEFKIKFVNEDGTWRGGQAALNSKGEFLTSLFAAPGNNVFLIELTDASGTQQPTQPERCSYTLDDKPKTPPPKAPHTFGIAVRGYRYDMMKPYIHKNKELPAQATRLHRTSRSLKKGQEGEILKVPILQGEASRAYRNEEIGMLLIAADQVGQNIPVGTEVEIRIKVDESFSLTATAFVPLLDREFEATADVCFADDFGRQFKHLRERLDGVRRKDATSKDEAALEQLRSIDDEKLVSRVEAVLSLDQTNPDIAEEVRDRLFILKSAIAEVEDLIEWPATVAGAGQDVEETRAVINVERYDIRPDEKAHFKVLEEEIRELVESPIQEPELLQQKADEMYLVGFEIKFRQPQWLKRWLRYSKDFVRNARDKGDVILDFEQAEQLLAAGELAEGKEDWKKLQEALLGLFEIIPRPGYQGEAGVWNSD